MSRVQTRDQDLEDLKTERDFLLRSIQDLDEEHRAGDVSEEDYSRLHDSYTARAAAVLRSIAAAEASAVESDADVRSDEGDEQRDHVASATKKRVARRRGFLIAGVLSVVLGIVVALVVANTSARLPGNTATGSGPSLSTQQTEQREIGQAEQLEEEGQYQAALTLFQKVVGQDPGNAVALSESGWLEFEAGVLGGSKASLQKGQSTEEQAVSADPGLPASHAYLGTMFFLEKNPAQAVVQYSQFIVDGPTASELAPFVPDIKKAFAEDKKALPPLTTATS